MLSATNSVANVKTKLGQAYAYYGYASDNAYTTGVTAALLKAKLLDMLAHLSSSYYDQIAAKDAANLSLVETYIYEAEVAFAACRFLMQYRTQQGQASGGRGGSISVEGYSRSNSGSGPTGLDMACMSLWNEARGYLSRCGFRVLQVTRGGSLLANQDPQFYDLDGVQFP